MAGTEDRHRDRVERERPQRVGEDLRSGWRAWDWKLFDRAGRLTAESKWKGKDLVEASIKRD